MTATRGVAGPALAVIGFLAALGQPAQAFCFCPECVLGVYDSYQPISGSMKPAIEPGACVIVQVRAAVERGDILVFFHPVLPDTAYVKRLIGLPGDRVELRDGQLILNGVEVPQVAADPYLQLNAPEGPQGIWPMCPVPLIEGETCEIARWTETLPTGASWEVLDLRSGGSGDDFGPITVPEGTVFLLGDHRDNSFDSRFDQAVGGMGLVPVKNLIGPVVEIWMP